MDLEEMFKDLSPEDRDGLRACKSKDELLSYMKHKGIALPDDLLAGVAGGSDQNIDLSDPSYYICPECGHNNQGFSAAYRLATRGKVSCISCGNEWKPF